MPMTPDHPLAHYRGGQPRSSMINKYAMGYYWIRLYGHNFTVVARPTVIPPPSFDKTRKDLPHLTMVNY